MLIIKYEGLKHYSKKFSSEDRKQADQLGWFLMGIGSHEINQWNITEILFRCKFSDYVSGSSYFMHINDNSPLNNDELKELFQSHIGLKIEITNIGIRSLKTRFQFMKAQIQSLEEKIDSQILENKKPISEKNPKQLEFNFDRYDYPHAIGSK